MAFKAVGSGSAAGVNSVLLAPGPIGTTTPNTVKSSNYQGVLTDNSGTPGNTTINTVRGRAAFAAAGSTVTVTSTLVTAASSIFVSLETTDATLLYLLTAIPAAGSFVVTGNAAATATTKFSFIVFN